MSLRKKAERHNIPVTINRVGSMFTIFFSNGPVENFEDAKKSDTKRFAKYFHGMLERGVFIPPSQYEAWFVSTSHEEEDLHHTIHSHELVIKEL